MCQTGDGLTLRTDKGDRRMIDNEIKHAQSTMLMVDSRWWVYTVHCKIPSISFACFKFLVMKC